MRHGRRDVGGVERAEPKFAEPADEAFYRFCRELLDDHFVTEETFELAHAYFGAEGLVDAVGSLGNFSMLGMCLNAFQVDLQPDRVPPFPDVRGYGRAAVREEPGPDGDRA